MKPVCFAVLALALAGGAESRAVDAVRDQGDAIDIARNVCRVDLGETDYGPQWSAERLGLSWRVRGSDTYQVWVRAADGKATACEVCAHGVAPPSDPCFTPNQGRPEGW